MSGYAWSLLEKKTDTNKNDSVHTSWQAKMLLSRHSRGYYTKRGSAWYIVREVRSLRAREGERERDRERQRERQRDRQRETEGQRCALQLIEETKTIEGTSALSFSGIK